MWTSSLQLGKEVEKCFFKAKDSSCQVSGEITAGKFLLRTQGAGPEKHILHWRNPEAGTMLQIQEGLDSSLALLSTCQSFFKELNSHYFRFYRLSSLIANICCLSFARPEVTDHTTNVVWLCSSKISPMDSEIRISCSFQVS